MADPRPTFEGSPGPDVRDDLITIGGRTYIGVDDGRQNVLVPYTYMTNPPGDDPLEHQRQMNRIDFLQTHPIGSVFDFVATAMHAPPIVKDLAAGLGGAFDTIQTKPRR
jgi:hypothetical protein